MPIIGVPLRYSKLEDGRPILYLSEKLRRTIQRAGGFILPIVQTGYYDYVNTKYNEFGKLSLKEKEEIDKYLDMVDGVIFPGGFKITPFDKYLLDRCIERNIKTLGICLGMQLMSCVGEDFKVYKNDPNINHYQEDDNILTHDVIISKDSKLYKILGTDKIKVNSFHRYHVKINNNYKVVGMSEDGLIEAIELKDKTFNVGVQWHPEISYDFDDNSKKLIDYFIKICEKNC